MQAYKAGVLAPSFCVGIGVRGMLHLVIQKAGDSQEVTGFLTLYRNA